MDGGVEEPLAPALGALAVARMLWDVEGHARMEHALTIRSGVTSAIEIARSPSEVHPDLGGHLLQGFQTLGQQDPGRLIDGCHGEGLQGEVF
jgi:hypothetical protein